MIDGAVQQVVKEMRAHPFTLVTVLALVLFAVWSYRTHARADTIEAEVKTIAEQAGANSKKIDRVLLLQVAEAIRAVNRQLCATHDAVERQALQRTLDSLQGDYEDLNTDGRIYSPLSCEAYP